MGKGCIEGVVWEGGSEWEAVRGNVMMEGCSEEDVVKDG